MSKRVTLKINEDLFYELIKLKGKFRTKTWDELFKQIIEKYGK